MAVTTMFMPDMNTLKTRLKLDGSLTAGGSAEIDTAVQEVAVGFYRRLGAARIAALQAFAYTDTPATDNDYLRVTAALCELAWTRAKLLRVKPTLFLDASGKALQLFNDEGAFRPNSSKAIDSEIAALSHQIEDYLQVLEGGIAVQESEINAATISPAVQPDLPGASAFPARRSPAFRGSWPFGGSLPGNEFIP